MTDQPLSQEMIDALLQQAEGSAPVPAEAADAAEKSRAAVVDQDDLDATVEGSADAAPESAGAPPFQASALPEADAAGARLAAPGPTGEPGFPLGVPGLQTEALSPGGEAFAFGAGTARAAAGLSEGPAVRPAVFSSLPAAAAHGGGSSIDLLLDVPLQVTVELGRTNLSVREVLGLGAGSVVEIEKLAGEPVDLLVNNRLIARGEVVVIDESFGVRVTEIVRSGDAITLRR